MHRPNRRKARRFHATLCVEIRLPPDTLDNPYTIDSAAVERRFDRAAATIDDADFLHALTRDGLIARLQPITVDAGTVVDLGCGTGAAIRPLAKRFRGARIIGVDRSQGMLDRCRKRRLWFTRASFVKADARELPFADHSVDVVYCNLLMPWIDDLAALAREVSRILRKDGLFSTLGPTRSARSGMRGRRPTIPCTCTALSICMTSATAWRETDSGTRYWTWIAPG